MFNALKSIRTLSPPLFPSPPPYSPVGRRTSGVRFILQAVSQPASQPENTTGMEKPQKPTLKPREDVMSNSFGEGYSTRSDEEGFGGTCGGNQSLNPDEEDKIGHENSPEYDKNQGCEVKEKERARHQK